MRFRQTPHRNPLLLLVVLIVCATVTSRAQQDTCTAAPVSQSASSITGYRIASIRWDPLLRQRWAKLVSCAHPELPAITMVMASLNQNGPPSVDAATTQQTAALFPAVHAGDLVRLWRQEGNLRIETSGIAEGSGVTGSTIRVRLLRSGLEGQYREQILQGIVHGPRDVEMKR